MWLMVAKWHSPVSCSAMSHISGCFGQTFDPDLSITDLFFLFTIKLNRSGWIFNEILDQTGILCHTDNTQLKIFETDILYICKT